MLLALAVTGLALAAIDQGRGPLYSWLGHDVLHKTLVRIPHEWLGYGVLAFLVAHVAALILHERRHGAPMAQAMVSGYQYRPEREV
jgi:cytochrome b